MKRLIVYAAYIFGVANKKPAFAGFKFILLKARIARRPSTNLEA
jgi:hypothetical protein